MTTPLRKQDGILKFDVEAFNSFFLSIDFLFKFSWAAGHYGGDELNYRGGALVHTSWHCTQAVVEGNAVIR